MKLKYTRGMLNAILSGALNGATFSPHPVFHVLVPATCPYVPPEMLDPRVMWRDGAAYDAAAANLSARFNRNFRKFEGVDRSIVEAAPAV